MPPHRPIDPRMVGTFWRGVERAGVTGREVAAHTGLDESAISRMRSLSSPTPLDLAVHTLDLTGPRPMVAPLAKIGLRITELTTAPTANLTDSCMALVERSAALARSITGSEEGLLEHIDALTEHLSQIRAAVLLKEKTWG